MILKVAYATFMSCDFKNFRFFDQITTLTYVLMDNFCPCLIQNNPLNLCVHVVNSQFLFACKKTGINGVIKGFRYTNDILKIYIFAILK